MVFEKVAAILAEQLDVEADDITLSTDLVDDLGADSLDIVDLVMTLEDEFDLEISDEDIEAVRTVGDIVKYLEDRA
ncbi:MAG: acyl carrier protein [Angelakisella sp.]